MAQAKRTPDASTEAESLRVQMRFCADELDRALALKIGVMDSESKARAIEAERAQVMQDVSTRLREA